MFNFSLDNFALLPLLKATWETVYMVFISGFISIILGLSKFNRWVNNSYDTYNDCH